MDKHCKICGEQFDTLNRRRTTCERCDTKSARCCDCGVRTSRDKSSPKGKTTRCRPCSYKFASLAKATANLANRQNVDCANCGKVISRTARELRRIKRAAVCSPACQAAAKSAGIIWCQHKPRAEPRFRTYGNRWRAQSAAARLRDSNTCQHCGVTRQTYGRSLEVHHIVRFGDFATSNEANVLSNLITLCCACHRRADAILFAERKARGETTPRRQPRVYIYRKRRFEKLAEFACIFARNWKITGSLTDTKIKLAEEDEIVSSLLHALFAINVRPNESRGLAIAVDRAQVDTLTKLNAEIEHGCWQFKLKDACAHDARSWVDLLASGDNKRIASATRAYYLDWQNIDPNNFVVVTAHRRLAAFATKREWLAPIAEVDCETE